MTAEIVPIDANAARSAAPQLRTLVVCDIAGSTALVERMGDQNAANVIRKHDRLARALLERHKGREIDKTDGFLLLFERPVQAAAFALDYQRGLKHLSAAEGVVVRARVGIHMGDVVIWENATEDVARGAKPIEVEGLAKPVAARLAQLARPQQILVSSAAAGIAHRAERELGAEASRHVHWKRHGRYRFKGLPEPFDVVEVGEDGVAPLHAPKSVRTARRVLPWWRRPLTLAAEAAVLLIGVGVGAWLLLQSPPTLAFGARDWVVVGSLHNLTQDKLFDQSVDSALRMSLEQSNYVNVLPEQSVRQTLQRMALNPDKAQVNRAVGAQVALRDGARALILPTVAEIGGRVRVTAEVIDPNTQATVYSVSADGVGAKSVLPSLDSVSKQLRGKLGEALAMVSRQSQPLAQVATPDLNALRAYSLGQDAYSKLDLDDAERYFNEALAIDPHFALAHVALAKVFVGRTRPGEVLRQLKAAQADPSRLSSREQLFVEAWVDNFTRPARALGEWKMLASVYPDYFQGLDAAAFFLWNDSNDFQAAIPLLEQAASPKDPHRAISNYILGALYVEAERYPDALRAFSAATKEDLHVQGTYRAGAYAAQRNFAAAMAMVAQAASRPGAAHFDVIDTSVRVAMALDQGDWALASRLREKARASLPTQDPRVAARYQVVDLGVQAVDGSSTTTQAAALAGYVAQQQLALAHANPVERGEVKFELALAGYLAARIDDTDVARRALAAAQAEPSDTQLLSNMRGVAEAELARASGQPQQAIAILRPLVNGSELYVTHVALMDVYASTRDSRAALGEARWLLSHRGRAYLENSMDQLLTPFNVAQSDLAILGAAEASLAEGDKAGARKYLAAFRGVWPHAPQTGALAARMQAIEAQLQ